MRTEKEISAMLKQVQLKLTEARSTIRVHRYDHSLAGFEAVQKAATAERAFVEQQATLLWVMEQDTEEELHERRTICVVSADVLC